MAELARVLPLRPRTPADPAELVARLERLDREYLRLLEREIALTEEIAAGDFRVRSGKREGEPLSAAWRRNRVCQLVDVAKQAQALFDARRRLRALLDSTEDYRWPDRS